MMEVMKLVQQPICTQTLRNKGVYMIVDKCFVGLSCMEH